MSDELGFEASEEHEHLEAAYAEIRSLLEERSLSLAADRCGRLLQDYPDDATAHALMGDVFAARHLWSEAAEWYTLAEHRGAGPEVSRRRAAAQAMLPRPTAPPEAPAETPDLHRQRTRILAIFGAAGAVVVVAVLIALLALAPGKTPAPRGPARTPQPSRPAPPTSPPTAPDQGRGTVATTPAPSPPAATPATPVPPGGGAAAPSLPAPAVPRAPVIITRRMEVPATDEDYVIARAVSALTWPDNTSMSGDVSVMMDPYQAYCVVTFRVPDTLSVSNLADTVVEQSYKVVLAALAADAAISAVTVRALATLSTGRRQRTTLQAFRANLTREAVESWRQVIPNPTAKQLREQIFTAVWWNPSIPQDRLR